MDEVERAQPWLGTRVTVRAAAPDLESANRAIDAAFAEIAAVHRQMSFHSETSDVSRLNREAATGLVPVHRYTREVLRRALQIARDSAGSFDITIGREMVDWNLLPRPEGPWPATNGCSRDIELHADGRVSFRKPLWIDLGGIAKGYAVDRAVMALKRSGISRGVVNAGGDLRVFGRAPERVALALEYPQDPVPLIDVRNGSVASSSGHLARRTIAGTLHGPHADGATRKPARTDRFVCVVAQCCLIADALTKIVMARGTEARSVLHRYGAAAHFCGGEHPAEDRGWQHL
jgi:thiamine biosynthesis lipoprotein